MNAKERFYSGLAKETIGKITSNTDNWTSFLRTMSRNYEFTYPEQVMIYAQRPNATFCKPYEDWNAENYRRYVKRGSTGIALFVMNRVLLCKQAAKNFHTICKKETALKRVLSNLLSAVSLLRFKAVFSCGFRVPPGSGLYQSCAAGSVCIPAGQKYCSPRPRKSCPADRKTPGLPSRCIGHRW